jgi:hypothetical protein
MVPAQTLVPNLRSYAYARQSNFPGGAMRPEGKRNDCVVDHGYVASVAAHAASGGAIGSET